VTQRSPVPARCLAFWQAYAATRPADPTPRFLEAFFFDQTQAVADELAALVLAGRKRATASLLWTYEDGDKPMPQPGDLSIVTSFAGDPLCVIETGRVDTVAFEDVTEEFAAVEGEGDGSLAHWRRAHEDFFGRVCRQLGREPHPRMPVLCERFEVVHV